MVGDSGRIDNVAEGKIGPLQADSKRNSRKKAVFRHFVDKVFKGLGGPMPAHGRRIDQSAPLRQAIGPEKRLHAGGDSP
jgi:hypothetical protein